MRLRYSLPILALVCVLVHLVPDAAAQVRTAAITAPMTVTVNGSPVTLTAEDREAIARASAAVRAALPVADREQVDWQAALTADQRLIVGSDGPEAWLPSALVARWRASGMTQITRARAAAEVEIAQVARRVLNQ